MRLKTAIFLLLACMTRLWAQEFTYVDWNILRPDTLPVQYTEVIPLDEDYRSFRYEVRLDYPEYFPPRRTMGTKATSKTPLFRLTATWQ